MRGADWSEITRRSLIGAGATVLAAGTGAFALRGTGAGRHRFRSDPHSLYRGNGAEPDTLDPQLASTQYENNIIGDMFLGLMTEDALGDPVPGAAVARSVSHGGLVHTFRLRNHCWSDGVPVTADDFVFGLRRLLDPKTAGQYAAILYGMRNAEAVNAGHLPTEALGAHARDTHTLELEFNVQVPYINELFTHFSTFAAPRHVIARHGEKWLQPANMVTNGAYVLKEWVPNDHILLEKNPRFYDAANTAIDKVYYYPTQDYFAALTRFRAGDIDVQTGVPPQEIEWLKYNLPGALRVHPYIATLYVLFNVGQKPFDDRRVREALSLAIDREVVAGRIMGAGEEPAYAFVPSHMPGYPGQAGLDFRALSMAMRAARARTLLKQAGFGPDNPLTFDFNIADTSDARLISVALQAMWQVVGAQARIAPSDEKNHYNTLVRRDFSVAWAGWVADYRDARDYLFLCQSTARDLNNGAYDNPEFDALLSRSDQEADPVKRGLLLEQAEQIMLDDVALAPVVNEVSRNLVSSVVRNWNENSLNLNRSRYLALDRTKPIA
jgi:oligopeptide transport system substrate-binding protein